jgi:arsenate reductase
LGKDRFRAHSAGSHPKGSVNPAALQLLESLGYETSGLRSKSWSEFARPDAPEMDFVFTVCDDAAGETCPVWPGKPMTAHWGIADPAAVVGSQAEIAQAFAEAHRTIHQRVATFVALPLTSLDRLSLLARLKGIGRGPDATAKAERQ